MYSKLIAFDKTKTKVAPAIPSFRYSWFCKTKMVCVFFLLENISRVIVQSHCFVKLWSFCATIFWSVNCILAKTIKTFCPLNKQLHCTKDLFFLYILSSILILQNKCYDSLNYRNLSFTTHGLTNLIKKRFIYSRCLASFVNKEGFCAEINHKYFWCYSVSCMMNLTIASLRL